MQIEKYGKVKNKGGGVLVYNLIKTFSPIFHWVQAAPTRYRDRS